jgi:hypothetical protein
VIVADPYSASTTAPLTISRTFGALAARFLQSPYQIITRREAPVADMSPNRSPYDRQAAIDHAIEVMDEPVDIVGELRRFSRDEMHELS